MKRNEAYVSAAEPTAPAQATRPAPTTDSVSAQWRDNLGMGIGVFSVLVSGFFIAQIVGGKFGLWLNFWTDIDTTPTWIAFSFLAGVQAYGWLMAWRSSIDEIERQNTINILRDNEKAMLADINALTASRDEYKRLYQNAQDDIAEMRRSLHASMASASQRYREPEQEIEAEAERNAKFLLQLAYRGEKWGRDRVVQTFDNWTPTMWTEARNLLELAGIVRTVGRTTELLKPDYATAVVALAAYCHVDQSDS